MTSDQMFEHTVATYVPPQLDTSNKEVLFGNAMPCGDNFVGFALS